MTVAEAQREAAARLADAGIDTAPRDARLLLAEALGCPTDRLTLRAAEPMPPDAAARLVRLVTLRAEHRPLSQVIGRRLFWGRPFAVTPDVLDPRPETETLIAAALAGPAPACLLDLGTGSGAILVTLLCEWPAARGTGTDTSAAALAVAARNADAHGVADRAALIAADWTAGLAGPFDLVACNPPYIPEADIPGLAPEVRDWEPRAALTAGPTGLEAYDRLAPALPTLLAPGGRVLLECGAGQAEAVAARLEAAGLASIVFHHDLDGRARIVEGRA